MLVAAFPPSSQNPNAAAAHQELVAILGHVVLPPCSLQAPPSLLAPEPHDPELPALCAQAVSLVCVPPRPSHEKARQAAITTAVDRMENLHGIAIARKVRGE